MTDILLPTAFGVLTASQTFAAVAGFGLRDFSRSRVEELCRQRNREHRFGEILRDHERVLLSAAWVVLLLLIGSISLFARNWLPADLGAVDATAGTIAGLRIVAFALWTAFFVVLLPWSLSRIAGEWFVVRTWPVLRGIRMAMTPFVAASLRIDRILHRLAGVPESEANGSESLTEEIRTVVEEGQREGVLESEATNMIQRVMELRDDDAATIMTPRIDMFCIGADVPLEEARRMLVEAGHSRVPVVGENQDDVQGVLYAKDLLQHLDAANDNGSNGEEVPLVDLVRDALYVPETTGLVNLLETMKKQRVHVAIVVDEYGGTAGLVTMEDVLEEIVGEIDDEYDEAEEQAPIRRISPTVAEVEARVHVDELNEAFGWELPEDGDYDTIGGFVFTELSRVPEPGETFEWRNLRFTVTKADKRRVLELRIERDESLVPATEEA